MRKRSMLCVLLASVLVFGSPIAVPAGGHRAARYHYRYSHSLSTYHYGYRRYRRHRSLKAKHEFETMTGHPHGWPGHVIDHIIPLACGGADAPSNMQWQSVSDGKAKDKWERKGCNPYRRP